MTAVQVRAKAKPVLLSGKPVRLGFAQNSYWSAGAGLAGACVIAGLYFLVLQQHWYIHIGSFNHGSSLKSWWDSGMGLIKDKKDWPLYRHGERDLGEPAAAGMAIRTLLASSKYWGARVRPWRLVTAPLFLLIMAGALIAGGIWVLDFGGPAGWAHLMTATGHHGYKLPVGFLGRLSLGNLILGALIGQVLHRFWAPIGATLQGFLVDRSVDKAKLNRSIPLWETYPIAPPPLRLRFAQIYRVDETVTVREGSHRKAYTAAITFLVLLAIYGALAKFVIPHGIHIPYMNP